MKQETFKAARVRLLAELAAKEDWTVRTEGPAGSMKTPWAVDRVTERKIWFKPQGIHLGPTLGNSLSMWIETRGLNVDDLIQQVRK